MTFHQNCIVSETVEAATLGFVADCDHIILLRFDETEDAFMTEYASARRAAGQENSLK